VRRPKDFAAERLLKKHAALVEEQEEAAMGGLGFDFGDEQRGVIQARMAKAIKDHFKELAAVYRMIKDQKVAAFLGISEAQVAKGRLAQQINEIIERTIHATTPLVARVTRAVGEVMNGADEQEAVAGLVKELESGQIIAEAYTPGRVNWAQVRKGSLLYARHLLEQKAQVDQEEKEEAQEEKALQNSPPAKS
jgi:hypothetical protein